MNSIRRRRREENDGEYYCNNAIMNTSERRRDVSLRSFSLSFSLSLGVTEQSAQNVMIFCRWKSDKSQMRKKKIWQMTPLFFSSVPLLKTTLYYLKRATITKQNTHETQERNENETRVRTMREYLFFMRACVCRNSAILLFSQTRNSSLFSFCANFLFSSNSTSSESRQEANERDSR